MSKITRQNSGKAAVTGNDEKVFSVRTLKDLNDVVKLQARLMRSFLKGEISGELFRTAMYGSRCMTATMTAIKEPATDTQPEYNLFGKFCWDGGPILGCGHGAEESLEDYNARMAEEATTAP